MASPNRPHTPCRPSLPQDYEPHEVTGSLDLSLHALRLASAGESSSVNAALSEAARARRSVRRPRSLTPAEHLAPASAVTLLPGEQQLLDAVRAAKAAAKIELAWHVATQLRSRHGYAVKVRRALGCASPSGQRGRLGGDCTRLLRHEFIYLPGGVAGNEGGWARKWAGKGGGGGGGSAA